MTKNCAIILISLFAILTVGYFFWNNPSAVPGVPTQTTLAGEYTCLPHKDTTGPITLECALGIRADDGQYYAVSTNNLAPETIASIQTGSRIIVTGLLVPIEAISSDHWRKYNVSGIIEVQTLQKL